MKKNFLLFLLLLAGTGVFAQTKKIAFKSHSGSAENFSVALEEGLFDMDNSNFGHAPQRDVKTAQLDSVIFVSDTMAFLVTSEYCKLQGQQEKEARLWKAGKEIVYHHPLFSRKHSLDSIKKVIKEEYNFRNQVEGVVFVGYDNKTRKYKGFTMIPAAGRKDNGTPFDGQVILIAGLIAALSLLAGLVAWKLYNRGNMSYQQVAA